MKRYWGTIIILLILLLFTQQVSYAQWRFNKFKSTYEELIKNYQFSKAVKLCEDALKDRRIIKDKKQRAEAEVLLDEAQRQHQIFNQLIERLTNVKVGRRGRELTKL
ncbi:unnamed protein product, partial [marine sediment metagenome]